MRFIMANRLSGPRALRNQDEAAGLLHASLGVLGSSAHLIDESGSPDRRRRTLLLEAPSGKVEAMRRDLPPEIVIEREILFDKLDATPFDLMRAPPADLVRLYRQRPLLLDAAGAGADLEIVVKGRRRSHDVLDGAEVHLFLGGPNDLHARLQARTDERGVARFTYASFYAPRAVLVVPYSEFWPILKRGGLRRREEIVCERLPDRGPAGWWHRVMEISPQASHGVHAGEGPVKVGVIDSGFGPHGGFRDVTDCGAFVDTGHDVDGGADSGSHGTHVCGIIAGGGPEAKQPFWGAAPGVELFSARVFGADGGANQGDIANALDHLVQSREVHLVNMSLGAPEPSEILHDAIQDAFDQGTVCICAAGNDAGSVSYPGGHEETVAVSAIGMAGETPLDSLPALPVQDGQYGDPNFHLADFSNRGEAVDCCAGGVGIISTVPARFGLDQPYAAMNGTSMAAPNVTGALALILSRDEAFFAMRADRERARYIRSMLRARTRSIGLTPELQGSGIPVASAT